MTCLFCNRYIRKTLTFHELLSFQPYQNEVICEKCSNSFSRIDPTSACLGCSRPLLESTYCPDCQKWISKYSEDLVKHEAFFSYDDVLKNWLQTYKILGDVRFAAIFRKDLKQHYKQHKDSIYIPLPSSATSLAKRGFNQTELLLQEAGIPFQQILYFEGKGKKQSEKKRFERMIMPQPFRLQEHNIPLTTSIILVDDIYTTGRTLLHAKVKLKEAGFEQIASVSIGR